MAALVDMFAAGQRAVAQQTRATSGGGPSPTIGSPERPGNPGSTVQPGGSLAPYFPIFGTRGGSDSRPEGPAQDWIVGDKNGNTVPFGEWPNQGNDYTSPDEIARRDQARRDAQAIVDMYRQGLDSGIAGLNDSRAALMNNQAARNKQFDITQGAYQNQLAGQLAEANLNIQGFDIQQQNFPQWYKFLAEKWGNAMTAGKADLDYIAKQQVNSANQRLIDWREIQQGKKEVGQQATTARRDATSSAVVGGVIQNAKQDYADIEQERGNALYGLDLADQKSQLSEKQRREELSNRRSQLIADLTDFDINTREGQAKLREREQLLGIEAQKARLKPRQLQDAMNVTMARLGLEKVMSQGQYLEAMANANAQERALLNQFNIDSWQMIQMGQG